MSKRRRPLASLAAALGIVIGTGCTRHDAPERLKPAAATPPATNTPVAEPAPVAPSNPRATAARGSSLTSSALAHLPIGCAAALRIGWTELSSNARGQRVLDSLFKQTGVLTGVSIEQVTTSIKALGIDPDRDLADVGLCALTGITPRTSDSLVILGGTFPERVLSAVPVGRSFQGTEIRGQTALRMGPRTWIVQAPDGALLFGTARDVVEAGGWAPAHDYGLSRSVPVSIHVAKSGMSGLLAHVSPGVALDSVEELAIRVDPSFEAFTATAKCTNAEAAEKVATELRPLLGNAPTTSLKLRGNELAVHVPVDLRELEKSPQLAAR